MTQTTKNQPQNVDVWTAEGDKDDLKNEVSFGNDDSLFTICDAEFRLHQIKDTDC